MTVSPGEVREVTPVPSRVQPPVAIVGPTGSGKTALGLAIAEHYKGEIVNCDAMQQYRGMDIGTAKTPVAERKGIPHHQLDVLKVTETATVAGYQKSAREDIERLLEQGTRPIIVGGSMLYIQSLMDDWAFPPTDPAVREHWQQRQQEEGSEALHTELSRRDPQAASIILPTDDRRIVRALEVITLTGQPFAASQPQPKDIPQWGTTIIGLDTTTEWLNPRLLCRTEEMFERGLVEETAHLCDHGLREGVTARRAIGYQQALAVLDGTMTQEEAVESTFIATRQYVRRQRAWFRRDKRIDWKPASSSNLVEDVLASLEERH